LPDLSPDRTSSDFAIYTAKRNASVFDRRHGLLEYILLQETEWQRIAFVAGME
jgi:hypothetical protein